MTNVWKIHPVATWFPTITGKEFDELKEDIKAHGIRMPILVNKKKDTILDGRNRIMAAHDLKLKDRQIPLEVFKGSDEEAMSGIISRNIHRRHLTDDQRVGIMAKLLGPKLTKEAKVRETAGLKSNQQGKAYLPVKTDQQGRTREKIAKEAKVSVHKAQAALETEKHAPKDLDDVIAGKAKLSAAYKKVKAKAHKKVKRPLPAKPLRECVETKFVRFMEGFAVVEYSAVRKILREILDKTMDEETT